MSFKSSELKDFVDSSIKSIAEGVMDTNCVIGGVIEFELSVVKEVNAGGGFDLKIVEAGGKTSEKRISKIKFNVISKDLKHFRQLHGQLLLKK